MVKFFKTFEEARTYRDTHGYSLELYSRPPDETQPDRFEWAVASYRTDELDYENDLWEMVSVELEDLLEDGLREDQPTGDNPDEIIDDHVEPFWRRPSE
jgi:hypothetical protein